MLLLPVGGCSDDDKPGQVILDSKVLPPDGNVGFLEDCKQDSDCASGRCVDVGGSKRCTRECDSANPCPSFKEWSCKAGVCECSGSGAQPDVCNVDGDCDGKADKVPEKESCNDEDDDCNGEVDDVSSGTAGADQYFRDEDKDGFGDDLKSQWSCEAPAGWVTKGGDCDDTQKDDYPGADEICGDTRDNDCDGQKEDPDVCGLTPITVPDVTGNYASATLKTCKLTPGLQKSLDITEIVAKQDKTAVKFTIRLAGDPAIVTCTSYILHFGDPKKTDPEVVYVYRPGLTACGSTPVVQVFVKGQPLATTTVKTAFNAADPGHVSFIIDKAEIFPNLPAPTYRLRACVNAKADQVKDMTDCLDDSCETPVHR
jgi:hypothetical protein